MTSSDISSDEWWSIDGVPLHRFGWSVKTIGGDRYGIPPRRGDNLKLAYRRGAIHRPKVADERTIELLMWVTGIDPATGNTTPDARLRFNDSWDFLRRLVWKHDGRQVDLTRRWFLTVDGTRQLVEATAKAEIADTMPLAMTGRFRADFSMTMRLADPYFYGAEQQYTIGYNQSVAIRNPGHDTATESLDIRFVGSLNKPRLTNLTPTPQLYVQLNRYVGLRPGQDTSVLLDVGNYTATRTSDGASFTGEIVNAGSRHWFGLSPGDNLVRLTAPPFAQDNTGHAVLTYRPPYV